MLSQFWEERNENELHWNSTDICLAYALSHTALPPFCKGVLHIVWKWALRNNIFIQWFWEVKISCKRDSRWLLESLGCQEKLQVFSVCDCKLYSSKVWIQLVFKISSYVPFTALATFQKQVFKDFAEFLLFLLDPLCSKY